MTAKIGRPRTFNEDKLLEDLMSVFWEKGYEGTGLSQIISATGLQKGSLYKVFSNKHDMYLKALTHYEKTVVDAAVSALTAGQLAPFERIDAFLSSPIQACWGAGDWRGCFLCNAAADYAAHDAKTRELVAQGYEKLESGLMAPLAQYRPDWPSAKARQAAQLCLSVYAGLRIMARASVSQAQLEGAKNMCLNMLSEANF